MRPFLRFFLSPSPPAPPLAALAVFFAPFAPPSEVVFAGAFEAVDAGAFPAVDAGLGAIASVGDLRAVVERERRLGVVAVEGRGMDGRGWDPGRIYTGACPKLVCLANALPRDTLLIANKQAAISA